MSLIPQPRADGVTVAFIGFIVAGFADAVMASIGIFLPVYFFTIILAPWFKRHRDNRQLKAFVTFCGSGTKILVLVVQRNTTAAQSNFVLAVVPFIQEHLIAIGAINPIMG